jgi:hypothetical protein
MGFRWKYRNGRRIRFWEDQWFDSCSLAIQFWELYTIVNEQDVSLREAWDGENLRFTFRRTVGERLMQQWLELKQIAEDVQYEEGG